MKIISRRYISMLFKTPKIRQNSGTIVICFGNVYTDLKNGVIYVFSGKQ